MKRACAAATALSAAILGPAASADTVSGTGHASITKDVETVRNAALADARRDVIRAMLTRTIGRARISEVPAQVIQDLAGQIRPDMITGQTSERQGNDFAVTITAEIDQAWFRGMLSDNSIESSSQRADNNQAMILVYLDRDDGVARDSSQPAEIDVTYGRQTGASYSDHSSLTERSKEAAASNSHRASASSRSAAGAERSKASGAFSQRGAAAYGSSGPYGSDVGRVRTANSGGFSGNSASGYSSHAASASASKSASAYAASSSLSDRTKVDAETHDDVSYHAHVVYQQPPKDVDGDGIIAGLSQSLKDYDIEVADPWMALSSYFNGRVPRYADLKRDPRYAAFVRSLKVSNTPFFMGGTFAVTQSGIDPSSNQSLCSGTLNAKAFASEDARNIGSAEVNAVAVAVNPEACSASLSRKLAVNAAAAMGKQIQDTWRKKAVSNLGQDSRQLSGYSLTLRAARLDMSMQADLMDALSTVAGVESPAFVSQTTTELRVNVNYAGSQPLQLAIFQKLRAKPEYAGMQASVEGRSILLCLSGCR